MRINAIIAQFHATPGGCNDQPAPGSNHPSARFRKLLCAASVQGFGWQKTQDVTRLPATHTLTEKCKGAARQTANFEIRWRAARSP
jgi:hypothetical protein